MTYSFCPVCGASLEKRYVEQDNHARLQCTSCGFIVYTNSRPTASVLIMNGDRVLLGKRAYEPSKGKWDVIGGFLELSEHPEVGARREVREEVGVELSELEFLGFFMDAYYGSDEEATLNIAYISNITSGTPTPNDDIVELQWFPLDALPSEIAFKNGQAMLDVLNKRRKKA